MTMTTTRPSPRDVRINGHDRVLAAAREDLRAAYRMLDSRTVSLAGDPGGPALIHEARTRVGAAEVAYVAAGGTRPW